MIRKFGSAKGRIVTSVRILNKSKTVLVCEMKKTLFFLLSLMLCLLFFATEFLFTAQAQSSKSIRKTESTTTDSGPLTALVIGNAGYSTARLRNPANDAIAIAATLLVNWEMTYFPSELI